MTRTMPRNYTKEEKEFLINYYPGHYRKEIQKAFLEKFGVELTIGQIKGFGRRNGLNTGFDGRKKKGDVPWNKGIHYMPGGRSVETRFKPGQKSINERPVFSERISKDGYVEIKIPGYKSWKLKHRWVWEQHNGKIPDNHVVIHKDGDVTNNDIDNLMLISRAVLAVINHSEIDFNSLVGDAKLAAIRIAETRIAIGEAKRRKK